MEDFKHLVLVKFKEGVVVDDLVRTMKELATEMETVKAFEWYIHIFCLPFFLYETLLIIEAVVMLFTFD